MRSLPLNLLSTGRVEYRIRQRLATICDVIKHGQVIAQGITFLKPGEENDPEAGSENAVKRAAESLTRGGYVNPRFTKALSGLMFRRLKEYVEGEMNETAPVSKSQAVLAGVDEILARLKQSLEAIGESLGISPEELNLDGIGQQSSQPSQSNPPQNPPAGHYTPLALPVGEFRVETLPLNHVFYGEWGNDVSTTTGYFVVTPGGWLKRDGIRVQQVQPEDFAGHGENFIPKYDPNVSWSGVGDQIIKVLSWCKNPIPCPNTNTEW